MNISCSVSQLVAATVGLIAYMKSSKGSGLRWEDPLVLFALSRVPHGNSNANKTLTYSFVYKCVFYGNYVWPTSSYPEVPPRTKT